MTNRLKNTLTAGAALGLTAAALTIATSAQAAPGDPIWKACATTDVSTDNRPNSDDCTASAVTVVSSSEVKFTGSATTNIEALDLDWTVVEGDSITFEYEGPCGGGAPRVYVTIGGTIYNTANAPEPCGTDGKVTYILPAGGTLGSATTGGWDVAAAGVVRDSGAEGAVTVSNVKIGAHEVNFKATAPPASQSPSATPSASVSVTPSATVSPSTSVSPTRTVSTSAAAPAPSQSTSSAGLPVTGAPARIGFIIGAILVVVGGTAIVVGRRRRTKFEA